MSLSRFVSLAVLLASTALVACSPLPANADTTPADVIPRALGYNCGPQYYSLPEADDAFGDAIRLRRNGQTYAYARNGITTYYPHLFHNGDAVHNDPEVDASPCNGKTLYEFPVLAGGYMYTGGRPYADRVVIADNGDGSYTQCFLMTHTGAAGNRFVKCT